MLFFVNPLGEGEDEEDGVVLSVIETELLMYGEVMPDDGELPWIANPEEAPQESDPEPAPIPEEETTLPEQETVVIEPEPVAEPSEVVQENRPDPVEHRPELAERQDRGETNPNRPENQRPTMGSQDGFQGGGRRFEGFRLTPISRTGSSLAMRCGVTCDSICVVGS